MSKLATPALMMGSVTPLRQDKARKDAPGYRMVNKGADRGEIYLYGIIGISKDNFFGIDGISAKDFADDLKALGAVKTIDLFVNSDGGIVDDARAIYNQLVRHGATIATHIDGIAASAASFVAMAGKTIDIAEGGFIMIHNARGGVYGEADDLRAMADVFDSYNTAIRNTYSARTKIDDKTLKAWMDEETWFTAEEAKKNGFVDSIVENVRAVACRQSRLSASYKRLPAALRPNRAAALAALDKMKAPLR